MLAMVVSDGAGRFSMAARFVARTLRGVVLTTMSTKGLHVAITGASSGLGAALASAYAGPGTLLSLTGRNKARLESVGDACRALGAEVQIRLCDVTDADAVARWLTETDAVRPLDIVFANAGIGGQLAIAPPEGEANAAAHSIMATNVLGVVNTATPIIPAFVRRRAGHFVVISSLAGLLGLPHSPAYCGAKGAVRLYAEGLRRLLIPHGVRVTVVNPGYIDTPMSRSLPFPGSIVWSAERAARAIKSAVARGKRELTFPWSLRLGLLALRLLPNVLADAILAEAYRRQRLS